MAELKLKLKVKALSGGVCLCVVAHHMSSSRSPNSNGEKSETTLTALSTGTWPFCGALDEGMGEVFVSATTNNKRRCEHIFTNPSWSVSFFTYFMCGAFWSLSVQRPHRAKHSIHSFWWMERWKSLIVTGRSKQKGKTDWIAKSILICKHNQYETCQDIYEVKKTKKREFEGTKEKNKTKTW